MTLDYKSLIYSVITVVGSLAPLLVSAFLLFFNSGTSNQYYNLIGHGEMSIISISLSISIMYSLYMMRQNRRDRVFDKYDLVFLLTALFFIAGIILYSFAASQYGVETDEEAVRAIRSGFNSKLTWFSAIFFVWICYATYLSKNHEDSHILLSTKRQNDQSELASKVKGLGNE